MTLSEIKNILVEGNIKLTKSLGQNFLHDGNQLRRIAASAELVPSDKVLEIGPGLGPLTELLIEKSSHVIAIEKDKRLIEFLKIRFASATQLTLIGADALEYLETSKEDWSTWKVVANLPYSTASRMLVMLAQNPQCPCHISVTLQREVAERIAAPVGSSEYGLLTLLMQVRYKPLSLFKIPAGCFFPEPDVDSACISLKRHSVPLLDPAHIPLFTRLVKQSFSQRRKMMLKLLKAIWPEDLLVKACLNAEISPQTRAEQVSLAQFVRLTQFLAPHD